jgi:hypothetical protein
MLHDFAARRQPYLQGGGLGTAAVVRVFARPGSLAWVQAQSTGLP